LKKNINQITFYFVEEGPGRGSEHIKRECNVNGFDVFFFSVLLWTSWVEKSQHNRPALKQNKKKQMHTGNELEAH